MKGVGGLTYLNIIFSCLLLTLQVKCLEAESRVYLCSCFWYSIVKKNGYLYFLFHVIFNSDTVP